VSSARYRQVFNSIFCDGPQGMSGKLLRVVLSTPVLASVCRIAVTTVVGNVVVGPHGQMPGQRLFLYQQ